MEIDFAPEEEDYLRGKVADGIYPNLADAVQDAVRKMRETDEQFNELKVAVLLSKEQNDKGLGRPFNFETLQRFEQKTRAKAEHGEKPKPDVLP